MKVPIRIGLGLLAALTPLTALAQSATHSAPIEVLYGKPYVMAMVNGKGPFRFILDTGTGGDAIITSELASLLELPEAGKVRLNDPSGRGGRPASLRLMDTLSVAGIEFHAIKAIQHPVLNAEGPCDGVLGFTLFRSHLLTLDYPHSRIIISDGRLEPDGDRTTHSFRMPDGVPITDLTIGSVHVGALLDSGGGGLSLPERLTPQLRFTAEPTVFARGESLSSRFSIKTGRLATDVHLGDITFDQPWVEINPAFPLANFGSIPMQHFALTFDQENLLFRIDGPRKRINLGVTPSPMRLNNMPSFKPADTALVPIG
jgi:hypothetical protein